MKWHKLLRTSCSLGHAHRRSRAAETQQEQKRRKNKQTQQTSSGTNPGRPQTPAFQGARPKCHNAPASPGTRKEQGKRRRKTKQAPENKFRKKRPAALKPLRFKGFARKCGDAPGPERQGKRHKIHFVLEPKSFGGFGGLCLRQLLALRASPPAAWGHTTGSASFRWSLRLDLAPVPRGVRQTLKKAGPHAWGWSPDKLRMPGVEPGSQAWEACMMPLHYMRFCT